MEAKADGNVPFQANRPRYNIVGVNTTIISHRMASGNLNGKRATTAAETNPDLLDPAVSAGKAKWDELTNGGVFFLGGSTARPLIIDAMFASAAPTVKIVAIDDPALETAPAVLRTWPGTFPVRLGANECLVVTGAQEVAFSVRLEGQKVL